METYSDKIKIVVGDITKLHTEAIVNAANRSLLGGGGVDGAIHRAAGRGLLQECMTLGGCETGQCKMTDAYNLPCKKVIHAVGPVWHGGHQGEGKLLASCYDSAMKMAEENELSSIAFSCISTGVYGFPKGEAARIALHTIFSHIRDGYQGQVVICCFSEEDVKYYQDCFWDESLTLLGDHEAIQQYKEKIDAIPSEFWDEILAHIPRLEQGERESGSTPRKSLESRLGFCTSPADYQSWTQCFKVNTMPDYMMIDNAYCLFIIGTFISRRAYWTNSPATPEELLEFLKPVRAWRERKR
ncbi:MAG: O-acetyl-ADP-ribose deacetylase [Prevotella sp.]|nr:O-acetyl-ADP-ribose deacetylase [Prevotella sp.]